MYNFDFVLIVLGIFYVFTKFRYFGDIFRGCCESWDMPNPVGKVFQVTSDKDFTSIKFAISVKYRIRRRGWFTPKFLHRWALGKLPKKQDIW